MTHCIYRFGDCRIDPAIRELWRSDSLVSLPPHVFDCLAYLVEHHDRAIGRDELVAAVWGRTEVSDTLLGQTMLRIRRELGDDGREQRIVRTIPRFGYRWVAPMDVVPRQSVAGGDAAVPAAVAASPMPTVDLSSATAVSTRKPTTRHRFSGFVLAALAGIVVLAVIFVGTYFRDQVSQRHPAVAAAPDGAISAAVVPAEIEPGAEWSWLRFSAMDVVATRLRTSGMPTVPSENMIALLQTPASRRSGSLRDAAGFRWLVSPRVNHSDDGWHVHLDADDGAGQRHVAEASARDATEAARLAADKLLVALGREAPTVNADAAPYAELIKRVDAAILAGDPATARTLIERTPAAGQQAPELRLRLAKIDFRDGHVDAARKRLLVLLDEAPAQASPVLRASILNGLGVVAIRSDQPQQAERFFAEAVELLVTQSEPAQLGQAYLGRAGAAQEQRHFEAAAADYSRARIAFKQANDTLALVRVDANDGFLDLDQGRPAQALPQLVAAGAGFEQWGALNEAVYTHVGQIACELALLEPAKAMDVADAAASLASRIENQDARDSFSISRGKALAAVGRLRDARALLIGVRDANPAAGNTTSAVAAIPLAQLELDNENFAAAAQLAATAVDALAQPGYANLRAQGWLIEIRALSRAADAARASARAAAFEAWANQLDEFRTAVFAQLANAEYARRFSDARKWRAEFDKARLLAERLAVPADIAAVASAYADALIAAGDLEAAAVEVGRLSRWSDRDFRCAVLEARLYAALGRDGAHQAALARARALAGERTIPPDARAIPISDHQASAR